jgi:Flp pilus assembly protein TadD
MGSKKAKNSSKGESAKLPVSFMHKGVIFQRRLFLLLLPLLIIITYSHTLHSPFVFDDIANISSNPAARASDLNFENMRKAAVDSPISTRPVSYITFAVNYFFHQHEVYGYRLVNLVIHVLNGVLLYLFLMNTFKLPILQESIKKPFLVAYFAALVWVIHPLQVQSVTYIVQRMNSLATLFYMLAFLCYLKARLSSNGSRRWVLAALSFASGILALGSKEIAVTLPFFILLYEWMFFQDMDLPWLRRNIIVLAAAGFFLAVMFFVYVGRNPWQTIAAGYSSRDFTMWQRLLTEPRVILHYIELFVFPLPTRLTLLPEFSVSTSLVEPATTIPAIIGVMFIISTAMALAKDMRLISFAILWFMGNLVVESSVVSLEIIFLHRTYLPSMMASLLVTYFILQHVRSEKIAKFMMISALLTLTFWTYDQNKTWCDKVYFWRDCLQKNQTDFRVYNNLAKALEEKGKVDSAIGMYEKAISVNPDHPRPYNNLGIALMNRGKIDEASRVLHKALEKAPEHPETHYNLGLTHSARDDLPKAEEHYLKAHEHFPEDSDPDVHNNLGITLARQGKLQEAVEHFREAVRINNDDPFSHNNLGITLARLGENREAIIHFQHALRINPNDRLAWNNLQIVIAELEDL